MSGNSIAISCELKEAFSALRNQLNAFEAETRAEFRAVREKIDAAEKKNDSRLNLLTVIVVIWILSSYTERVSGG